MTIVLDLGDIFYRCFWGLFVPLVCLNIYFAIDQALDERRVRKWQEKEAKRKAAKADEDIPD